ncbi:integral membrane protein, TerC family [Gemmatirosa kalamazoonensis]|uniref:Integral membrane protein, TerC family n=1 Tax=Gemmatirosa kalamazoonensis TaxID=861299 RepID=W0RJ55_9BACT|nr:TerC family protein [Gemmatirosa kalamazoonensis]AHG90796.1 integral membrane protein, TerC family [Gemmatirosa kalamazoonensis]
MSHPLLWAVFTLGVLSVLALDLGVFHRRAHVVRAREAATWSVVWITLAALFGLGIYYFVGRQSALEFAAGYLVEEALSVDNLFVFLLLFSYFKVPEIQRHRVLFWGILGALLMRGAMIALGAALIHRFHWIIFVFGAFLVYTGARMAVSGGEQVDPEHNPALKLVRRVFPVTPTFRGQHFFVRARPAGGGAERWFATPLFIVLVLVETTDLVFAVDSIPAIFGVTNDPFIVYTSNVFAILGLRSLFFLLAGAITRFHLLRYGLAAVLAFVGVKMLVSSKWPIPIGISLGVIAALLGASVVASLLRPAPEGPTLSPRTGTTEEQPVATQGAEAPREAAPNERPV